MESAAAVAGSVAVGREAPDFAALVRDHQSMVFGLACRFLRNRSAAEELAQDVFLRLHRNLDRVDPDHLVPWLRRVTANRCIDEARRRKRRPEVPLEAVPETAGPAPAGDLLREERLRRLVASLPAQARLVVLLHFQEDMTLEEVADTLGLSLNTVKSRLHRSLVLLRRKTAVGGQ